MSLKCKEIQKNFSIRFDLHKSHRHLTDWQSAEVDKIWAEQQKSRLLYDGLLLSVKAVTDEFLIGDWVDYRFMVAQQHSPSLRTVLNIIPVGISAVTRCGEYVLIGKRAGFLANYPNCYECAPSGGVDADSVKGNEVDIATFILKELEEEVGIFPRDVAKVEPTSLCFDAGAQSYEVVVSIELIPEAYDRIVPTMEYPEIFWLKKSEITSFINLHKDAILPLSQELLKRIANS